MKVLKNERMDEEYYFTKTPMGLDIFYIPKRGFDKQYAILSTDYGSVDNIFKPIGEEKFIEMPEGIAHFLEHKLFEEPDKSIDEEFARLGANVNAFTSFNQTSYLFSTTTNFYENLVTLINFVQTPYFTDENVEKEKGIIEQEIKMYEDDPNWRVYFNSLNAMYHNNPVKYDIAGTVDSIMEIDKELLYKAYDTFYHPENMVLFIVGDLDKNKIMETVIMNERKDFKKIDGIDRYKIKEPKSIKTKIIIDEMMTYNPLFHIGIKDITKNISKKDVIEKEILTNIILEMIFGNSSKFYNDIYDEGLVDNNFGAFFNCDNDYGHSFIVGDSEKPELLYKRIIDYLDTPKEKILLEEDFNRIKNDEIGSFIMSLDSIEFIANRGTDLYFSGFSLFDYLSILENLNFKKIMARYDEHFKEENMILSIVNPMNSKIER